MKASPFVYLLHAEYAARAISVPKIIVQPNSEVKFNNFKVQRTIKEFELASAKMPNAHLYQGDFTQGLAEALKRQSYDFIIATYSIHHLRDDQKIVFLKELLDHLKDDGKILIGDVAFSNREELNLCKEKNEDVWDDDEIYCIADELRAEFPGLVFRKMTFCSGILTLHR